MDCVAIYYWFSVMQAPGIGPWQYTFSKLYKRGSTPSKGVPLWDLLLGIISISILYLFVNKKSCSYAPILARFNGLASQVKRSDLSGKKKNVSQNIYKSE